jgi:uncharacterized protein (TIGR02145 family)
MQQNSQSRENKTKIKLDRDGEPIIYNSKKHSKRKVVILILIVVILAIIGYVYFTFFNKKNEEQGLVEMDIEALDNKKVEEVEIDKNLDTDQDKLPDYLEKILRTEINNSDTDGDGYNDLDEIKNGYSPLTAEKFTEEEWEIMKEKIKGEDENLFVEMFEGVVSSSDFTCGTDTIKDIDNNIYNTVQIGEQCWLKENLKVTKNPAGEEIIRYCYNNDPSICETDGGLYDWNTAMNNSTEEGAQGICPSGWHVPKDGEWYVLESGLASGSCDKERIDWGCDQAETKLRLNGSSGFDGILVGYRSPGGDFSHRRSTSTLGRTFFWSSLESEINAWIRDLGAGDSTIYRSDVYGKTFGFSLRCLKD